LKSSLVKKKVGGTVTSEKEITFMGNIDVRILQKQLSLGRGVVAVASFFAYRERALGMESTARFDFG